MTYKRKACVNINQKQRRFRDKDLYSVFIAGGLVARWLLLSTEMQLKQITLSHEKCEGRSSRRNWRITKKMRFKVLDVEYRSIPAMDKTVLFQIISAVYVRFKVNRRL